MGKRSGDTFQSLAAAPLVKGLPSASTLDTTCTDRTPSAVHHCHAPTRFAPLTQSGGSAANAASDGRLAAQPVIFWETLEQLQSRYARMHALGYWEA